MSYDNPWEHTEMIEDEPMRFACACGDIACVGWDDDPQNVRVGTSWYAADCKNKPLAVVEDQDRAFRQDVIRDEFNERRR